jgi:hypothetical protein
LATYSLTAQRRGDFAANYKNKKVMGITMTDSLDLITQYKGVLATTQTEKEEAKTNTLSDRAIALAIDIRIAEMMRDVDKRFAALKNATLPECEG